MKTAPVSLHPEPLREQTRIASRARIPSRFGKEPRLARLLPGAQPLFCARASIGIAMGAAGTDAALETADIVLMGDSLQRLPYAISLSRQAKRVVMQNLFFASLVIIVLITSALVFGLRLAFGVIGHEGSTVVVVLNGLRLLHFHPRQT